MTETRTPTDKDYRTQPWNSTHHTDMRAYVTLPDDSTIIVRPTGGEGLRFHYSPHERLIIRRTSPQFVLGVLLALDPGDWRTLRISYIDSLGRPYHWTVQG